MDCHKVLLYLIYILDESVVNQEDNINEPNRRDSRVNLNNQRNVSDSMSNMSDPNDNSDDPFLGLMAFNRNLSLRMVRNGELVFQGNIQDMDGNIKSHLFRDYTEYC